MLETEIKKEEERKYSFQMLERQIEITFNTPDKTEQQKLSYELLSKLVRDLFKYKNSDLCYKTISNLIIVSLMMFNNDYPLDIYELMIEDTKIQKDDGEYKKILKDELNHLTLELPN
ncbi:MAG: hypothetical protein BAJALOKI2v1_650011 [Promethearchaeota archaeon]|jgi:hypothetical protein|nr:MAG: hypothetical protein BAJALOKI2v1_650011 [Candidatus Lokiarchaeota archaeon]